MATEFTFDDLITASEAKALGVSVNSIFFSQDVLLEGEKKKTSKEKKKLFISSKRVFLLSTQTKSPKVELNINLLNIKEISTPDDTHILIIYLVDAYHGSDKTKAVRLEMTDDSSSSSTNTVVALLSPMHAVLGADMASKRIQLVIAEKRKVQVLKSVDDNIKRVNQNRSHGTFPDIYSLLCDYIDIPMNEEVAWDIENTYNSHAITTLSLNDFPKLASRDMVPVIRSMEFSRTLDSIRIDGVKLCSECIDAIVYVCKNCNWLKGITINGSAGLKHDFITKLFQYGFLANTNCQIDTLDLSDNPSLEDKAIQQLATQLALVPHGLKKLSLNNTGISSIGYASLSRTFTKHPEISNTLWYLSLSRNHFSSANDFQAFLSYFSTTSNKIQELYLSDTGVPLDQIFQALHGGSTNYLSVLDLSNNNKVTVSTFKNHSPKSLAYKQFFSTAKVLRECNLSNCKLTPEIVDQIMQGLNENSFLYNLSLNLSQNYFSTGTNAWPQLCSTIKCLHSLDLSYTSLDDNYLSIFSGIFSSHYLKELNLSGNFRKNKHLAGVVLADLLQSKDCQLKVLKVVDCKLGDQTSFILRSLIANSTLRYLDISGNLMNHSSAQTLARMISNNATLVSLRYDDNNLTIDSMLLISNALEYNNSITDMPLPLRDLVKIKREHEKDKQIDAAVTKIESFLLRNHSPSRYDSIHSSGRKFLLHLINEKQTLIDKKIETLEQKLQQVSEEDVNKEFITTITQLVNKCGTLSMVFENLYSERTELESLSDDSAICDITQALKEEMTKKIEAVSTEMMDKLQFAFSDIITQEVFKSTTQTLNDVIQGKMGKKDDNPLPDSSLAETKLLNLISEGVSSNIATKHLDLARLLVNIVSDYIFTRLEETQDKLDKQIANNYLSPVRTPLSPETRGRSSSINRFQMAFTSSMKRARVSCITTGPPIETEEDLNDDSVSRSNDQLPLSPDTESVTCEAINDDKDVDLGDFIPTFTLNEDHNDTLEEATYPSKATPTVVDTSTSSDAISVINEPTCPTTDDLSATPPPSPASTTISTDTTPSISDSTTISSNSSTPATIESTDDLLNSTATASRETVLEDTPPDTIASKSEPLGSITVTPNKESTELERKTSTKKGLISKGLFGRSKKEQKNVDTKSAKKDKKDKKDTTSIVRTPSNTSSDFTPPTPADEIVKSKPKTEVSFLNIDEVSSNAKQAPDISMFRSKPKGPPRRPPIRQATPSLTTKEPTPDSDVFSELVNQTPSGLDAVIADKPKRLQLEYAKTVGVKRMSVMDPSGFTGAAIDFDKGPTTPKFESSLSDGLNINIGTPTQPPIILPKKPPYKGKVPILPPPNLASVLEGGLKATKLRNSRSSENIILEMNKEETENIPSSVGVLSSQLKKVTPPSRAKKPMLSTPERAPKPKFPDVPSQDQNKSFTNAVTASSSNSANEEASQQVTNSTNQKIKTEEITLLSDSTDLTSDSNNNNDNNINNTSSTSSTSADNADNIVKTEKNNDSTTSTINTETDQLDKENISDNINTAEKVLHITLDATTIKDSKISPTKPPTPVKPPSPAKFNKNKPTPAERKKLENSLNDKFELIVEDGQQTDDKFTPQLVNSSDASDADDAISEIKQSSDEKIQSPIKNKLAASKSDEESHTSFISAEANSEGADAFDSGVVNAKRSSSMSSPKYKPSLPQNDKNVEKTKDNSSPLKSKDQTEQEISPNKPKPTTPKPQAFATIQTNAQNSARRHTAIGVKPKIEPKKPIISPRKEIDSSDSHSDSSQKSDTPSKNIIHPLSDSYDANSNISESPEKQTEPTESK